MTGEARESSRNFTSLDELEQLIGEPLGSSDWITIDQETIDRFADLTSADNWSHVDRERSAAGPFGTTIAQGMLLLSLGPPQARRVFTVDGFSQSLNYGFDKVRFVAPVAVGSRVRVMVSVIRIDRTADGARITTEMIFEVEGSDRPACVASAVGYHRR
jgi:acyl dehydratase